MELALLISLNKKLKNYDITILSSQKVKAERKVEKVKYVICDVTFKKKNFKNSKKKYLIM